ncbi:MAG TPA: flavodoxin domain-containing protein [Actinomycetota bacterium]|nr:flavodoxin domain-containing protein [Actinomycetota bacterium]
MKALVIYESMFGNTAEMGEAVAAALARHGIEVESGPVSRFDATALAQTDLLVVGGPTHAHGMSSKGTRKSATADKRYTPDHEPDGGPGIREWLNDLPSGSGRPAASFDTRFQKPRWLTGSAAKGIAERLEQHGYRLVAEPQSFFVTGEHRLEAGQAERATAWGDQLADRVSASPAQGG